MLKFNFCAKAVSVKTGTRIVAVVSEDKQSQEVKRRAPPRSVSYPVPVVLPSSKSLRMPLLLKLITLVPCQIWGMPSMVRN